MKIIRTCDELKNFFATNDDQNPYAFVPTMGNIHEGHLSLIRSASRGFSNVIVSIFVNPTQFGVGEDFESYPRTIQKDLDVIRKLNCVDIVFIPSTEELYPSGLEMAVKVSILPLCNELCGKFRPTHFDGVLTVILRMVNLIVPKAIFLGRKDYQQYILINQMFKDLMLDIDVVGVPTIRDENGLALSSRNQYLSITEIRHAQALYKCLLECSNQIQYAPDAEAANLMCIKFSEMLESKGFCCQYLELRSAKDLLPVAHLNKGDSLVLLVAAKLGRTRLIDSIEFLA
jgi:pantoate--beta-alanine ligase